MGLDAPPADYRGKSLRAFSASRDLPGVRAYYDALALPDQADNSVISVWPDSGPFGADLQVGATSTAPLYRKGANGINGQPAVQFSLTTTDLRRAQGSFVPVYFPLTMAAVIKASTVGSAAHQAIIGGENNTFLGIQQSALTPPQNNLFALSNNVASGSIGGGPGLNDGQPHVVVAVCDIGETRLYTDGKLTTNYNAGTANTANMLGISVGSAAGIAGFVGLIGRAIVLSGALDINLCADLTEYLSKGYGL